MEWAGKRLDFSRAAVMAIVNVTDDSFYAASRAGSAEDVARAVRRAVDEGADIIDIGGYSTRPGAPEIPEEKECERVVAGIEAIKSVAPETVVSVDTFRAGVAAAVLGRWGDCIINDISAGEFEPEILDVVAQYGVPYVAMHTRGRPSEMMGNTVYGNVVEDVAEYLQHRAEYISSHGVKNLILDPGFGFAKTLEQNYILLGGMECICALGYPVLAGISRKSMLYKVLGTTPQEALSATTALHWECLRKGAKILRVHDVKAAADTVRIFEFYKKQVYGV